ncbi:MAG TPA: hypothetical protein VGH20_06950 [Myxococcales bacterium]|jgi:hypothetical protein
MPSDIFAITAKESGKKLDTQTRQGTLAFTVANTQDRAVKARATAKADAGSNASVKVDPETVWLNPHESKDFKVSITVPGATPGGPYGVKLSVVDEDAPDEFASTGPSASFEVPPKPVDPGGRFRWWWVAIPVGVIALGAAAYIVFHDKGKKLHEACKQDDQSAKCEATLACVELSGSSKECRLAGKEKCKNDADCASYWCHGGTCSADDGKCSAATDCRQPDFMCTEGFCLAVNGMNCSDASNCQSHYCDGVCKPPPVTCSCPKNEVCFANNRCIRLGPWSVSGYARTMMRTSPASKNPLQ